MRETEETKGGVARIHLQAKAAGTISLENLFDQKMKVSDQVNLQ